MRLKPGLFKPRVSKPLSPADPRRAARRVSRIFAEAVSRQARVIRLIAGIKPELLSSGTPKQQAGQRTRLEAIITQIAQNSTLDTRFRNEFPADVQAGLAEGDYRFRIASPQSGLGHLLRGRAGQAITHADDLRDGHYLDYNNKPPDLDAVSINAHHMARALEGFRNLFAGRAGRGRIDFSRAASDVARAFKTQRKVELRADIPNNLVARGDYHLTYLALYNLVRNAVNALTTRTTWTGKLFYEVRKVGISARLNEGTGRIEWRVSDTAGGMPSHVVDYLEGRAPLETINDEGHRLGFGLACSKDVVERQGGRLRVESTGPKGTTVLVEMPAAKPRGKRPFRPFPAASRA